METAERSEFLDKYHNLVFRAWTSDDFTSTLLSNPQEALREVGLTVSPSAKIVVKRSTEGDTDLDAQVKLWEAGSTSGEYVVYVPETPTVDTAELSEADLDAVAGGDSVSVAACCCCCPCCSA